MASSNSKSNDKIALLKKAPIFQGVTDGALENVATVCQPVEFKAGTTIFKEGDQGTFLLVIDQGEAEIRTIEGQTFRKFSSGDLLGEIALVDGGPRTATVTAKSTVTGYKIEGKAFNDVLGRTDTMGYRIGLNLARVLAEKARFTHKKLTEKELAAAAAQHGMSACLVGAMQYTMAAQLFEDRPQLNSLLLEIAQRNFEWACEIAAIPGTRTPKEFLENVLDATHRRMAEFQDSEKRIAGIAQLDEAAKALRYLVEQSTKDVKSVQTEMATV